MEREKIIDAMKVIKETCEGFGRSCPIGCPFHMDSGNCYITFFTPSGWRINEPEKPWKAYV